MRIENLRPGTCVLEFHTNEGLHSSGLYVAEPDALPKYRAEVIQVASDVTEVEVGDCVIAARYCWEPLPSPGRRKSDRGIVNVKDIEAVITHE